MVDDKKKFGRNKAEAIKKARLRDDAFRKQCAAYKKKNGPTANCKNMNFNNPVKMSAAESAQATKSKGVLTEKGKIKADDTIRKSYN